MCITAGAFPLIDKIFSIDRILCPESIPHSGPDFIGCGGTASVIYCFCCTLQAGIRAVRSHMNTGIIKERDEYGRCRYCGQRKVVRRGVGFAILDRLCFGCVR